MSHKKGRIKKAIAKAEANHQTRLQVTADTAALEAIAKASAVKTIVRSTIENAAIGGGNITAKKPRRSPAQSERMAAERRRYTRVDTVERAVWKNGVRVTVTVQQTVSKEDAATGSGTTRSLKRGMQLWQDGK